MESPTGTEKTEKEREGDHPPCNLFQCCVKILLISTCSIFKNVALNCFCSCFGSRCCWTVIQASFFPGNRYLLSWSSLLQMSNCTGFLKNLFLWLCCIWSTSLLCLLANPSMVYVFHFMSSAYPGLLLSYLNQCSAEFQIISIYLYGLRDCTCVCMHTIVADLRLIFNCYIYLRHIYLRHTE